MSTNQLQSRKRICEAIIVTCLKPVMLPHADQSADQKEL